MTPIKRFWLLLHQDRREINSIYLYAIFSGIISLTLPLGIQSIINLIQGGRISYSYALLVAIVLFGLLFNGILHIMQMRIIEDIQQKVFVRSAFDFAFRIPRISPQAMESVYAPELMNRFFDTLTIQKGLPKILIELTSAGIQILFGLTLLSFYHPVFILFSLFLMIVMWTIFKFTFSEGLRTSIVESKYKYKVAAWLEELARTRDLFRQALFSSLPLKQTDANAGNYIKAREIHFTVLKKQFYLFIAIKLLIAAGLLIIGGLLVLDQRINIGQFVAAEIIILLVLNSAEKLVLYLESIYDVLTSLEKIGEIMDIPLEVKEQTAIINNNLSNELTIELKKVSFKYGDKLKNVLQNISLNLSTHNVIKIEGKSDSGKSTFLHLLAGLINPTEGTITANSIPLHVYKHQQNYCMIFNSYAHGKIFEGTILENITLGAPIDYKEIIELNQKIFLQDFINQLPQGIETPLLSEGIGLSKSNIQKILIARCIICKPRLLVFEHCPEHISIQEREQIYSYLTSKSHNWILIAANADAQLSPLCNKTIQIQNGELHIN